MQRNGRSIHDGNIETAAQSFRQNFRILNDDQREENGKYPHVSSLKNLIQTCTGNRRTDGVGGGVQNQNDSDWLVYIPFHGGNKPTVPGIVLPERCKLTRRQTQNRRFQQRTDVRRYDGNGYTCNKYNPLVQFILLAFVGPKTSHQ